MRNIYDSIQNYPILNTKFKEPDNFDPPDEDELTEEQLAIIETLREEREAYEDVLQEQYQEYMDDYYSNNI